MDRKHTGRRRNEETRAAVLEATLRLLEERGKDALTMEGIARAAGVGKQTLYRWWSSPGAILLEAVTERAVVLAPATETDDPRADLEAFLVASFQSAAASAAMLRALLFDTEEFRAFTAVRRAVCERLLARAGHPDPGLAADIVYGVLWYRLLGGHRPLDAAAARELAASLARAA